MFRDETKDLARIGKLSINVSLSDGGMGDIIAGFPTIKYMHDTYKHLNILLFLPDFLWDLGKNVFADTSISVRNYTTAKKKFDTSKIHLNTRVLAKHSSLKCHATKYSFHTLCDEDPLTEWMNYLPIKPDKIDISRFDLPEKYVVVTTGYTAPNREFIAPYVNELVEWIKSRGYDVVFLGKTQAATGAGFEIKGSFSNEIDYSKGYSFINKTKITEAAKIIAGAKTIVGLDNGLMHLAACTEIPVVCGYTNVNPRARMPYRHNEMGWNWFPVLPPTKCRGCQTNFNYLYGHAFSGCWYSDFLCLKDLEPKLYQEQLEKIL